MICYILSVSNINYKSSYILNKHRKLLQELENMEVTWFVLIILSRRINFIVKVYPSAATKSSLTQLHIVINTSCSCFLLKILSSRFPPRQRDTLQCFRQRQKEQKTVIESPLSVSKIESWTLKVKKRGWREAESKFEKD